MNISQAIVISFFVCFLGLFTLILHLFSTMNITDQFGLHYDSIKNEKKKCHGNRRLQRFRRNYRKQGLNDQTIEMLVGMHQAIGSVQQNAQIKNEEKLDDDSFISTIDHNSSMLMASENRVQLNENKHEQKNEFCL